MSWFEFICAGIAIGILIGLFGVGGSSVATPVLSVLGVPGFMAVASPLPATIPSTLVALVPYLRKHETRPKAAAWTLLGAVPSGLGGALLSQKVGGSILLILSGILLIVIGIRILIPINETSISSGTKRRKNRLLLVVVATLIGFASGLLANGGGFLLVPMYLLIFGLDMRESAGTSLLVISCLTVPILAVHIFLGHVNWTVATAFTIGAVPSSLVTSQLSKNIKKDLIQKGFGIFLIFAGTGFMIFRLV